MNEIEEKIVETQTTTEQEQTAVEPQQPTTTQEEKVNEEKVERTFTQDEVNEIVRKRLEKQNSSTLKNYNVETVEELESLLTKGREHQKLCEEIEQLKAQNRDLIEKDLFTTFKIDEARIDDVKTYFKGKELDLNEENLKNILNSHQEWVKKLATVEIGAEKQHTQENTDAERRRIFGNI